MPEDKKRANISKYPKVERKPHPDGSGDFYEPFTKEDIKDLKGMVEDYKTGGKNSALRRGASLDVKKILNEDKVRPESPDFLFLQNSAKEMTIRDINIAVQELAKIAKADVRFAEENHIDRLGKKRKLNPEDGMQRG